MLNLGEWLMSTFFEPANASVAIFFILWSLLKASFYMIRVVFYPLSSCLEVSGKSW